MGSGAISDVIIATVRMATPLLIVALAELYSERAGMTNIGLDGIMAPAVPVPAMAGSGSIGVRTGRGIGSSEELPFLSSVPRVLSSDLFLKRAGVRINPNARSVCRKSAEGWAFLS